MEYFDSDSEIYDDLENSMRDYNSSDDEIMEVARLIKETEDRLVELRARLAELKKSKSNSEVVETGDDDLYKSLHDETDDDLYEDKEEQDLYEDLYESEDKESIYDDLIAPGEENI